MIRFFYDNNNFIMDNVTVRKIINMSKNIRHGIFEFDSVEKIMKFQRLVNVLIFYFYLLMMSGILTVTSKELKNIHAEDSKLRLVSAVFRHGNRVIDRLNRESYPNDPYKNYNFYPVDDGQLTNDGKEKAYELGLLLRNKYNSFLGDVYYPPNVYARSTWLTRTKMTLQLVLAALYPPVNIQKWHSELSWQPMDLIQFPLLTDKLLYPMACPKYNKILNNLLQSPKVQKKMEEFNDFAKEVSKHTGNNITDLLDLAYLYSTLYAESSMKLHLPEWTRDIFPNGKLLNATVSLYELFGYNKLNKLIGGVLLNRIVDDMSKVINGTLKDRKINLFSVHDINVAAMLHTLNIFEGLQLIHRFPAYTSSIIIELHEKDGMYFVKVLYYLGIPSHILEVTIPGCEILCPYNKFVELMRLTKAAVGKPCHPGKARIDGSYELFTSFDNRLDN